MSTFHSAGRVPYHTPCLSINCLRYSLIQLLKLSFSIQLRYIHFNCYPLILSLPVSVSPNLTLKMSTREKHPDRIYSKSLIGECAYWRKMLVEIYALHSSASEQVAVRDYFNKIHLGYPTLDSLEFFNPDPPPSKTRHRPSSSHSSAEELADEILHSLNIGDSARLFDPEAARLEAIAQLKNNSYIQAEAKKELSRDKSIRKEVKQLLLKDKYFRNEVKEQLMEDDDLRDEVKEQLMDDDDLRDEVKEELKEDDDLRDEVKEKLMDDHNLRVEVKQELMNDDDLRDEIKEKLMDDHNLRVEVKEELMKDDDLNLGTNLDVQSIRTYF